MDPVIIINLCGHFNFLIQICCMMYVNNIYKVQLGNSKVLPYAHFSSSLSLYPQKIGREKRERTVQKVTLSDY